MLLEQFPQMPIIIDFGFFGSHSSVFSSLLQAQHSIEYLPYNTHLTSSHYRPWPRFWLKCNRSTWWNRNHREMWDLSNTKLPMLLRKYQKRLPLRLPSFISYNSTKSIFIACVFNDKLKRVFVAVGGVFNKSIAYAAWKISGFLLRISAQLLAGFE